MLHLAFLVVVQRPGQHCFEQLVRARAPRQVNFVEELVLPRLFLGPKALFDIREREVQRRASSRVLARAELSLLELGAYPAEDFLHSEPDG